MFRIDNGSEPWAWEVSDTDAPVRRIDSRPELVDWGYCVNQEAAMVEAHQAVGLLRLVQSTK